jgi:hypothetical protein
VTVDGALAGSTKLIDKIGRMQKIDELFELLRSKREAWKALNPDAPFPGVAVLEAAPKTSRWAFASAFQTCAYAGYPNIHVAVGDRYVATRAQIPGPPCGTAATASCEPPDPTPIMHIQGNAESWWIWTRREDGSLAQRGGAAVEFLDAFAKLSAQDKPRTFVFHVPKEGTFATFAPFLERVADSGPEAPYLSIQDIESSPNDSTPRSADAGGEAPGNDAASTAGGRLPATAARVT